MRGKLAVGGWRKLLLQAMFRAALVESHYDPVLVSFVERRHTADKPPKIVVTAVARKLVAIKNAFI